MTVTLREEDLEFYEGVLLFDHSPWDLQMHQERKKKKEVSTTAVYLYDGRGK